VAAGSAYMADLCDLYSACAAGETGEKQLTNFTRMCRASVRGLEGLIHPAFSVNRKKIIQSVLNTQNKVTAHMSPQRRAKVIAEASKHMSKPFVLLAHVYGNGDAAVAQEVFLQPTQIHI